MATDSEGRTLPPNTYYDSRGYYKYLCADGKKKTIKVRGIAANYQDAVAVAVRLNAVRPSGKPSTLEEHLNDFILASEARDPKLSGKPAWRASQSSLRKFVAIFGVYEPSFLTPDVLFSWWQALSYDQQHLRRSVFSRFFQHMINSGVSNCNPFTKSEDVARLIMKVKPDKQRGPLLADQWRAIYNDAETPEHVRLAMVLAHVTMWRISDLISLRFSKNVTEHSLKSINSKSVNQRDQSRPDEFEYLFEDYPILKTVLEDAKQRAGFCDYVISRKPKRVVKETKKAHPWQLDRTQLSKDFSQCVRRVLNGVDKKPCFHETKGLAIRTYLDLNDEKAVQIAAGHTKTSTTRGYAAQQEAIKRRPKLKTASTLGSA